MLQVLFTNKNNENGNMNFVINYIVIISILDIISIIDKLNVVIVLLLFKIRSLNSFF